MCKGERTCFHCARSCSRTNKCNAFWNQIDYVTKCPFSEWVTYSFDWMKSYHLSLEKKAKTKKKHKQNCIRFCCLTVQHLPQAIKGSRRCESTRSQRAGKWKDRGCASHHTQSKTYCQADKSNLISSLLSCWRRFCSPSHTRGHVQGTLGGVHLEMYLDTPIHSHRASAREPNESVADIH